MEEKCVMTRRSFLSKAGVATLGASCAIMGIGGCMVKKRSTPKTYYTDQQEEILKTNRKLFKAVRPLLAQQWNEQEADAVIEATLRRFAEMIPDIPYIGGSANDLTANLINGVASLAFFHEMTAQGASIEVTGRILFRAVESMFKPDLLSGLMGRLANSALAQKKIKQDASLSQKRLYTEDWVFEFVPGNEDYDFGIDFTECGIDKYFRLHDAQVLTPFVCLCDAPISRSMGTGLVRTRTLARGGDCCDFRYRLGRDVKVEWDPGYVNGG